MMDKYIRTGHQHVQQKSDTGNYFHYLYNNINFEHQWPLKILAHITIRLLVMGNDHAGNMATNSLRHVMKHKGMKKRVATKTFPGKLYLTFESN